MNKAGLLSLLLLLNSADLLARGIEISLPQRPPDALKGTDFARSIAEMPLKEREERIFAEIKAGNVPPFLRRFVPVDVTNGSLKATFFVAPDYLAIGSDDDYFSTPLTPYTAQKVADLVGCTLPTPKMVDDIYRVAAVKLTPSPIPPTPAMTTIPVFLRHNQMVLAQRPEEPPGRLVAGHKKDVVIANKVFGLSGKVAIYGWHRSTGDPIQPLYVGHTAAWVDYSHGIRLVHRQMTVDGETKPMADVLADPRTASLLSHEGPMRRTRYELAEFPAEQRPVTSMAAPDETIEEFRIDRGVRIVINRPRTRSGRPVLLVFYGLPNGNTIEQAIGKAIKPGDDWHFEIQHIGAQTRFLREAIQDRELVVAYLENGLKSWPSWRRLHGDEPIPAIVDFIRSRFDGSSTRVALTGHSGGGSFLFGYLNAIKSIPDTVERIAFLDANYGYESGRHRDKMTNWLDASDQHFLCVLAYDDARALLDGKPFISEAGGTWGRSRVMRRDLEASFPFEEVNVADLKRATTLRGRVGFLLLENPDRKVLHTLQVEKNGFIEAILSGTRLEGVGYSFFGDRAYARQIRPD